MFLSRLQSICFDTLVNKGRLKFMRFIIIVRVDTNSNDPSKMVVIHNMAYNDPYKVVYIDPSKMVYNDP